MRRIFFIDLGNVDPGCLVEVIIFCQFLGHILNGNPHPPPGNLFGLGQLVNDTRGKVRRDGKANPLSGPDNGGIDANDISCKVQQRPAAVPGINGGVCLDKIIIGAGSYNSSLGTDDPCGHGLFKAKGTADGNHPGSHLGIGGTAEF